MGDFERPQSRLSFVSTKNTDLKADLEKLSLLNEGDANKMIVNNDNNNMEGACGPIEQLDEKVTCYLYRNYTKYLLVYVI